MGRGGKRVLGWEKEEIPELGVGFLEASSFHTLVCLSSGIA